MRFPHIRFCIGRSIHHIPVETFRGNENDILVEHLKIRAHFGPVNCGHLTPDHAVCEPPKPTVLKIVGLNALFGKAFLANLPPLQQRDVELAQNPVHPGVRQRRQDHTVSR